MNKEDREEMAALRGQIFDLNNAVLTLRGHVYGLQSEFEEYRARHSERHASGAA